MYTFFLKDNGPDLDMIVTRAMLVLAAIAAAVYRNEDNLFLSVASSVILFAAAVFLKFLQVKFGVNKLILLISASVVLFLATHSIAFAVILLSYGYVIKLFYREPLIEITGEGILIKKNLASSAYQWNEFSNIILKDNLLTLDFKNNKLIQLNIDENKVLVDINEFNSFCKRFIKQ